MARRSFCASPSYATDAKLAEGVSLNPRVAPQMIGLGLIEAISDADIKAHADPDDADGDGVSGRVGSAGDEVGRFGWKAMAPSLIVQSANAFSNDMGLSTRVNEAPWGDCTDAQTLCRQAPHGNPDGGPEIADDLLDLVAFYSAHLAVPARRAVDDPEVLRGKAMFYQARCTACHVPKFATRADAAPPLRNQLIWPYSDFLLHDMGLGLADANPTGDRAGSEWRTPPLWGIGLTQTVNGHTYFLHDGRARSLEEAILWHDGEARAARDAFAALRAADRAALIALSGEPLMRLLAALLLATLPVMAAAESALTADARRTLQSGLIVTADTFILPAYSDQSAAADDLHAALVAYCSGQGSLEATRDGFAALFLAWQRASLINIGPIAANEGPMRVQIWPDPKGFSQRAIRAALRDQDAALLQDGGLEGRSIALTSLTAVEYLLYSDPSPESYACDLAVAIAAYHADLAAGLVAAWTPGSAYRQAFDGADRGNATYAKVDDVLRQVLAGAVVYVDRLRKFKILRGMGDTPGQGRPERTEARLSGLGLASIEVSFRALADLYNVPFGLFDIAPDVGGSIDYLVLADTATSIADAISIMDGPLTDIASADGARAAELRRFADLVLYQETFLKSGFMASLGLSSGFTAADGD